MKICLIGYGGMGSTVGRIAMERGHGLTVIVDKNKDGATHSEFSAELAKSVDLVIDCSLGEFVVDHVKICCDAGTSLLVVATGWYEQLDEIRSLVEEAGIGFMWSSNFSIGVNLYFKMVATAAEMVNNFDEYDVWGHEMHHNQKADSPSGTAKSLGKILLEKIERKNSLVTERLDRRREENEIHFSSLRGGEVNFAHTIGFDSVADTITLTHSSRNRGGYALGAVKAAEWLSGKNGYFEMDDFLTL